MKTKICIICKKEFFQNTNLQPLWVEENWRKSDSAIPIKDLEEIK